MSKGASEDAPFGFWGILTGFDRYIKMIIGVTKRVERLALYAEGDGKPSVHIETF